MRPTILLPLTAALAVLQAQGRPDLPPPPTAPPAAGAEAPDAARGRDAEAAPTLVKGTARILDVTQAHAKVRAALRGTDHAPRAQADAWIRPKGDGARVLARIRDLPPARDLGGDALTYVLWSISPAGKATNLGEVAPRHGRARIEADVEAQVFGLVVTAEPYFAVARPGDMAVLTLAGVDGPKGTPELAEAAFEQVHRPAQALGLAEGEVPGGDPKAPLDLQQARNAVRIARAAGAPTHAGTPFGRAEALLAQAEAPKGSARERALAAREAVRIAEDARDVACQRQEALRVAEAKREAEARVEAARLEAARAAESDAKARMQASQAQAEASQAQAEADQLRGRLREQLNSVLQTRETAKGLIVNMSGVLFKTGKAELTPAAREKLAKIAGILTAHRGLRIEAEGHTDSTGTEAFNRVLSEKRAEATRAFLVSQGVRPEAITSRGYGEASPIATNDTPQGRQENRRVELVVTMEKRP